MPSCGYSSNPAAPMKAPAESPAEATTPAPAGPPVSAPSQAPGYCTVSGTVTDSNGTAVTGAIIQLQSKAGAQYSTTSGANGHYELSNVKYDTYTTRYTKGGYVSPATTLTVDSASLKNDISLPATSRESNAVSPAATGYADIKNWYATRYTPPMASNKSLIYDRSGRIARVVTGNPCSVTAGPAGGYFRRL